MIWLVVFTAGCNRPELADLDNSDIVGQEARLAFKMETAEFYTNGTLRSDRISLESEDFAILFVYLPEAGLYVVTVEETPDAEVAGQFRGRELLFSGGRTEIRFRSVSGPLFQDGEDRDAWVEYIPSVRISADIVGPVVGLARLRSHVPGLPSQTTSQ